MCKSCKARSDLHATSVLSFPNVNQKKNPYIYAKLIKKTPKKSKKSKTIFSSRDQCHSLENICHSFLMASLQVNAMGL